MIISNKLSGAIECTICNAKLPFPKIRPSKCSFMFGIYLQDVTRFTAKHLVCEAMAAKKEIEAFKPFNIQSVADDYIAQINIEGLPTVYAPYIPCSITSDKPEDREHSNLSNHKDKATSRS